jgi:hypothetical protein
MEPMRNRKIPITRSEPPAVRPTPHGPEDVISPATQFTSSHDDTMNNPPHATMHDATVT